MLPCSNFLLLIGNVAKATSVSGDNSECLAPKTNTWKEYIQEPIYGRRQEFPFHDYAKNAIQFIF